MNITIEKIIFSTICIITLLVILAILDTSLEADSRKKECEQHSGKPLYDNGNNFCIISGFTFEVIYDCSGFIFNKKCTMFIVD